MKTIEFAVRYYRGEVFREWLQRLWDVHGNHGNELVMLLGTPRNGKPGLADNVYAADRLLLAAEYAGWIKRAVTATPTMEQRFFGVGGMRGNHNCPDMRRAVEFWWEPNRENEEAVKFLEELTMSTNVKKNRDRLLWGGEATVIHSGAKAKCQLWLKNGKLQIFTNNNWYDAELFAKEHPC